METMLLTVSPLTFELLRWCSHRTRTYAEAMEAWRSNCPRHSVWEDAILEGLIEVIENADTMDACHVVLTERGRAMAAI